MVFLGIGFGVTKETWYPKGEQTGAKYDLPEGLAPLARHKSDFTVVQGCSNQYTNEAHWGSTFWLTGANRYSVPGQNMANSISADQVVAQHLGQDTRFSSIQLNAASLEGHGPGLSLAWDQRGKPVAGQDDPVVAAALESSAEMRALFAKVSRMVRISRRSAAPPTGQADDQHPGRKN